MLDRHRRPHSDNFPYLCNQGAALLNTACTIPMSFWNLIQKAVVTRLEKPNRRARVFPPRVAIGKYTWQRESRSKEISGERGLHSPSPLLEMAGFSLRALLIFFALAEAAPRQLQPSLLFSSPFQGCVFWQTSCSEPVDLVTRRNA